ncbi:MAG: hypothetical protein U0X92_02620 [Anaerolineales bacterium]
MCALCASALDAAGYKVGLYTSPHLLDFCERIQVNGEPISHEFLAEIVEEIKPAVARIPKLTTFEITTALGFLAFAKQGCDAAVIEVGLGGRLDATNIVTPRSPVITSYRMMIMALAIRSQRSRAREQGLSSAECLWFLPLKRRSPPKFWSA